MEWEEGRRERVLKSISVGRLYSAAIDLWPRTVKTLPNYISISQRNKTIKHGARKAAEVGSAARETMSGRSGSGGGGGRRKTA